MAEARLTAASLIERLQQLPPDMPIVISFPIDFGDDTGYGQATDIEIQDYYWHYWGSKYPDLQIVSEYRPVPETEIIFKGASIT